MHRNIGAVGAELRQRGTVIDGAGLLDPDDRLEEKLDGRPRRASHRCGGRAGGAGGKRADGTLDLMDMLLELQARARPALDCCQALLDLLELGAKRGVVGAQPVEAADIFGEMLAVPLDGAVFPAITTRGVPPAPESDSNWARPSSRMAPVKATSLRCHRQAIEAKGDRQEGEEHDQYRKRCVASAHGFLALARCSRHPEARRRERVATAE